MRLLPSTLNRLVLTYGLGLLLAFGFVGAVSFVAFERLVERDAQQTVRDEHESLMDVYRIGGRNELRATIEDLVHTPTDREAMYLLVDRDGHVIAGHRDDLPAWLPAQPKWMRVPFNDQDRENDVLAYVQPLHDGGWLLTGHATGEQQRFRELVLPLGAATLAALAALSVLLGWLLRRSVDRALRASLDTVDRVGAGRLDERVPVEPGAEDAFARLGDTLNRMLDRIHVLVGGIQASTDALAHDLRTPLARLRTRLEQARMASTDPEARAALDAANADADALLATFNGLLRLARIEGGNAPLQALALENVVADAVELWQAVMESKGQTLQATLEPAQVDGDRDLLFQLASNLLDNASKYAGEGARIRVSLRTRENDVELCVEDDGPGMSAELRECAFDRLVRGEEHRGSTGSGLGLSVVRAIALHHGAQWRLEPLSPGLRVRLDFPRAGGARARAATWTNRHAPESGAPGRPAQSGSTGNTPVFPTQTQRNSP
jgi:signal transduction histidine kinase